MSCLFLQEIGKTYFKHFKGRSTNISYLDFGLKPAVYGCHTNAIAPPPITLESCSRAQTDRPVFKSALEKIFFGWGLRNFLQVTS